MEPSLPPEPYIGSKNLMNKKIIKPPSDGEPGTTKELCTDTNPVTDKTLDNSGKLKV